MFYGLVPSTAEGQERNKGGDMSKSYASPPRMKQMVSVTHSTALAFAAPSAQRTTHVVFLAGRKTMHRHWLEAEGLCVVLCALCGAVGAQAHTQTRAQTREGNPSTFQEARFGD